MATVKGAPVEALRITLEGQAAEDCKRMIAEMKSEGAYLKIVPSRLVGLIVTRYLQKFFASERAALSLAFFDSQSFLATELPKAKDDDERREILARALAALSPKPPGLRQIKKLKNSEEEPQP